MPAKSTEAKTPFLERVAGDDYFEDEVIKGVDLSKTALGGKEFFRCTFENLHLQESNWKGSTFEDCTFRQCDLTRAKLMQVGFRGVRFEGCKLMGIDWSVVSQHPELHFEDCNLRYAAFVRVNLRKTEFLKCSVKEASFIEADLTDASFPGTDAAGANVQSCSLTRTDFSRATGVFIDPSKNKVKDTRIATEASVMLARHHGFVVTGFDGE